MKKTAIILFIFAFSSCSLFSRDEDGNLSELPETVVQTNASSYVLDTQFLLELTLSNTSSQPVYYDACGDIFLHEIEAGEIINEWQLTFLRCFNVQMLPPQEKHILTFNTETLLDRLINPRLNNSVDYQFRLYSFFEEEKLIQPLDPKHSLSNAFKLLE